MVDDADVEDALSYVPYQHHVQCMFVNFTSYDVYLFQPVSLPLFLE